VLGRGGGLCWTAGAAVSAGRAAAAVAECRGLVRTGAAFVGFDACGRRAGTSAAARVSDCLSVRRALVCGQLLLDLRHDAVTRRIASGCFGITVAGFQPGAGTLLWVLRAGGCFFEPAVGDRGGSGG